MTGMRRDNVLLNHCGFENCLYWRPYTAATGTVRADGGGREGDTKERAAKLGCDGDKGGSHRWLRRGRRAAAELPLAEKGRGDWRIFGVNVKKYWGGYDKKERNYLEIG